ncbi:hypothetical protein [Variovorax sp. Varisp62]|uniref:hypothetical protein n=1 Tax=Variovorax sp. Varisp62 TaxID=3243049 RepID=UPI0039B53740
MVTASLPPKILDIANGKVTWGRLEGIDYETLGYFLSCHLIVEHYLDEFLRISYPTLDWAAARHTFGQKVALLSDFKVSDKYDCIPAIKHMNSLRNRLSHNIDFKIELEHLLPLTQYLTKASGLDKAKELTHPRQVLEEFTSMSCVLLAGYISGLANHTSFNREK